MTAFALDLRHRVGDRCHVDAGPRRPIVHVDVRPQALNKMLTASRTRTARFRRQRASPLITSPFDTAISLADFPSKLKYRHCIQAAVIVAGDGIEVLQSHPVLAIVFVGQLD